MTTTERGCRWDAACVKRGGKTHSCHRAVRAACVAAPSILSAAMVMMDHMDLFDGEPYLPLLPRRLVRVAALGLLIALAFIPPVRQWWIDQAVKHATHEIQPLINDLLRQSQPSPSDRGPSNPAQWR